MKNEETSENPEEISLKENLIPTNEILNFKFIKKETEDLESRCQKTNVSECNEVCKQSNGILVLLKDIHYCMKFKILRSYCYTANFSETFPTLQNGCYKNNATETTESESILIENDSIYQEMTYEQKVYNFKDIRFILKDISDPYVIAYKIGQGARFYDIKKRTLLAKFLEYFLGFVTVF